MLMLRTKITRATMIYAIIVMVALSALASANVSRNEKEENTDGNNGKSTKRDLYSLHEFKFNMKERLGHFKRLPFTNLYRNYMIAKHSDTMNGEKIAQDENAWYRPDYNTCYGFLSADNRVKNDIIQLKDLLDFIVADACAAYVVKKVYEQDGVSKSEKEAIEQYTKACERFYDTRIDHFHPGKRSCIADLLQAKVYSRANHKNEECHHSLIQAFIQFAECSNYYMLTNRFDDIYVKFVYGLVRSETKLCFLKQLELITDMIKTDFGDDSWLVYFTEGKKLHRVGEYIFTPEQQQQIKRLWNLGLTKVLKAVENTKKPINLREVNRILSHQQNGDGLLEDRFLTNVGEFATEYIKPFVISETQKYKWVQKGRFQRKNKMIDEAMKDPTGTRRYKNMVNTMCSKFRVNLDSGTDYVKPLIRLVKLLDFPFTFDIDEPTFVETVVTRDTETAPVYLAVIACHFLGLTEGTIRDSRGKPHYEVKWLNNADVKRVVWPLARYV